MKTPHFAKIAPAVETLIVQHAHNARVLDLFCKDGTHGLMALAHGAASAIFIDLTQEHLAPLKEHCKRHSYHGETRCTDAFLYLKGTRKTFDIIVASPPHGKGIWIETLRTIAERPRLLSEKGIIVVTSVEAHEYEELDLTTFTTESIPLPQRRFALLFRHKSA